MFDGWEVAGISFRFTFFRPLERRCTRPDLAVRKATTDDAGAVRRVARRAWRATCGFIDEETAERRLAQGYSTEFLEEAIESPELTLFVAGVDGGVVGYVS